MTKTRSSIVERTKERGSALIGVLLLLMVMSALAAALGVSGQTETLIARNQRSSAQAQAAAEAGLNHAVELTTRFISQWSANGFGAPDEAVDALLVGRDLASGPPAAKDLDNGMLWERDGIDEAEAFPDPSDPLYPRKIIAAGINASYEAFVMDDNGAPGAPEDPDPLNDDNDRLIVRATGYAADGATVTLEAYIGTLPFPAVATNGDLLISGSPTISGAAGGIHTNGDLTISGDPDIAGNATASGLYTETGTPVIGGAATEGARELPVPEISALAYEPLANYILGSDGVMTARDGTVQCTASSILDACVTAGFGWTFVSPADGWNMTGTATMPGTYYVQGKVQVSSNIGPVEVTIIAEGSIDVTGSPEFNPFTEGELLFVTDGDLRVSGAAPHLVGQMLVHEQLEISSNVVIEGQILVEDAPSGVDSLFTENVISAAAATMMYNGTINTGIFTVRGWRDVRDAD